MLKRRLLFVVLRIALAVLLLSDVSTQPVYTEVYESPVLYSGLSPINTAITEYDGISEYANTEFFWYYNTIFSDTRNVRVVEPLSCPPGEVCNSYFMPGNPSTLIPDTSQPQITAENFPDATSFIQHDAPGYQLDFSPIKSDGPPIYLRNCKRYGASDVAIEICLQNVNGSFMAGNSDFSSITYNSVEFMSPEYCGGQWMLIEHDKHDRLAARRGPKHELDHLRTSSYNSFRSLQPHNYRHPEHF